MNYRLFSGFKQNYTSNGVIQTKANGMNYLHFCGFVHLLLKVTYSFQVRFLIILLKIYFLPNSA